VTVAASILLAAVVGGVVFVLIDGWQRREAEAPAPAVPRRPEPRPEPARPAPAPLPPRRDVPAAPSPLWSGWADREPR
jgi:hypothetical protein